MRASQVAIDREEAGHLRQGLDFQGAVNDITACVEYLLSKGCVKVGVVGFWYTSDPSPLSVPLESEFL